ncbi:MAG: glycosyltransferase [Desulfurococcaceae archaeon]
MKILHIWNTAGVASTLAKFMDRIYGSRSTVIYRRVFDKFGHTIYGELMDCGAKEFVLRAVLRSLKYDIIHIHSLDKLVPIIRILNPRKPIVLHYHGSEIRGKWMIRKKFWNIPNVVVLVSTKDLLNGAPEHVIYLPNPVDTDIFHPNPAIVRKPRSALAFRYYIDEVKVRKYAEKYGLELTILEREYPYLEMPRLLSSYEFFIDRTEIPSLSKTALEALACGTKVIRWDGEIIDHLPEEHKPENVVRKLYDIYRIMIEK